MFAGRDGRTADAEHQRKQQQHIYDVYGPPSRPVCLVCHAGHVRGRGSWSLVTINSRDFWCIWSVTVISLAIPHLLIPGFLRFTWVGTGLGHLISTWSICWKCRENPQLLSTTKLLISSFGILKIHFLYCRFYLTSFFPLWTFSSEIKIVLKLLPKKGGWKRLPHLKSLACGFTVMQWFEWS
jgi:hypothetical protein